ncbi:MAG: AAA family ATPase [Gammaproteobacteria bacterium]|nr:AAA family ATPase [Gammaproteobacteria bacterium]
MYEQHFGLAKPPFRITPDPEFFFPGGNRGAVLEALCYAVSRGEGIVKVVGEVGSGKTMLCRMLERELPPSCEIVYLANPRLGPGEILHAIAFELKLAVAPGDPRLKVMHALQDYLLAAHAEGRRVIMFVEEAQGMPLDSLEEMRMLSNLETTRDKLLQIVLFGQPELDDKLNTHEIRQLRERITHSFELAPLDRGQIRDYLVTRVRASGYRGNDLFSPAAVAELARHSEGLLRRINVLADKALLAAFAANAATVTPAHVRLAARDSAFGPGARPRRGRRVLAVLAAASLAAVAVVAWLSATRENLPPASAAAPAVAPSAAAPAKLEAVVPAAAPPPPAVAVAPAPLPTVDPATGLVTLEHLAPRLAPLPEATGESPSEGGE